MLSSTLAPRGICVGGAPRHRFAGRDTRPRPRRRLAFHRQATAQHSPRHGPRGEARRAARPTQWAKPRATSSAAPGSNFASDLRYGAATLRRNPAFAATAILTIALGLAGTVTVFSFINSIYLRPLDVPEGPRLVRIFGADRPEFDRQLGFPAYRLLRQSAKSFDAVAAHYSTAPLYLSARNESAEEMGAVVSADYFRMLGIRPALGRFFAASEDSVPDRDAVAVIAHNVWMRRFAGDPGVIGERIAINGRPFTIVGVAPERFTGAVAGIVTRLWIPTMMLRTGYRFCDGFQADCAVTSIIARLAPGATLERARAEISAMTPSLVADHPGDSIPSSRHRRRAFRIPAIRFTSLTKLLSAIAMFSRRGLRESERPLARVRLARRDRAPRRS